MLDSEKTFSCWQPARRYLYSPINTGAGIRPRGCRRKSIPQKYVPPYYRVLLRSAKTIPYETYLAKIDVQRAKLASSKLCYEKLRSLAEVLAEAYPKYTLKEQRGRKLKGWIKLATTEEAELPGLQARFLSRSSSSSESDSICAAGSDDSFSVSAAGSDY